MGSTVDVHDGKSIKVGDLISIAINGTNDSLEVLGYFSKDGFSAYGLENVRFADGTVWNTATVKAKILWPTSGDDTLIGYASNDTIEGGDGNDTLYGNDGNDILVGGAGYDFLNGGNGQDTLIGGAGNDNLIGNAGNDVLDGGAGNDSLRGDSGVDTYLFGRGSGQDTINNLDHDGVGVLEDSILIGEGIETQDVTLSRSGENLLITINGTNDSLEVLSYFAEDGFSAYGLENLRFADGTVWNTATVKAKMLLPRNGDDTLIGYASNDTIDGGDGSDTLYGNDGNDILDGGAGSDFLNGGNGQDTLIGGAGNDSLSGDAGSDFLDGGAGNDSLSGGSGNDFYLFGRDAGSDTISESDWTANNFDALMFGAEIAPDQLWFRQVGNGLEVSIIGTKDKVTLNNWYSGTPYHVEQLSTYDGHILSDANVLNLVEAMASFSPPGAGQTSLPASYQTSLTPVLAANWQ